MTKKMQSSRGRKSSFSSKMLNVKKGWLRALERTDPGGAPLESSGTLTACWDQGRGFPRTTCGLHRRKPWILTIGLFRQTLTIKAEHVLLDIQGLRKELKGTTQNRDLSY